MDIETIIGLAQAGGGIIFLIGLVYVYRAGESKEKRLAAEVHAREQALGAKIDRMQGFIESTLIDQIEKNTAAMQENSAANRELAQAIHALPCRSKEVA